VIFLGVKFPSERARRVFAEHGAKVEVDKQSVCMPPDLVLQVLSRAPHTSVLSGRAEDTDLVLDDDEIYHTNRFLAQGIDTGDEGLALHVIAKVGPRGHFLAEKHTRRHMRDVWIPALSHPWQPVDGSIRQQARAELDRILANHKPEPLEEAARAEL
jgi:trimethylamine:corrinoid methyltransferase-like protein